MASTALMLENSTKSGTTTERVVKSAILIEVDQLSDKSMLGGRIVADDRVKKVVVLKPSMISSASSGIHPQPQQQRLQTGIEPVAEPVAPQPPPSHQQSFYQANNNPNKMANVDG